MAEKKNNLNSSETEFTNEPKVENAKTFKSYEELGGEFDGIRAWRTNEAGDDDDFVLEFGGSQICGEHFKTLTEAKKYLRKNVYRIMPVMAHIYIDKINNYKANLKTE